MTDNTDAIQHAGEIPADIRPYIEAPGDTPDSNNDERSGNYPTPAGPLSIQRRNFAAGLEEARRTHTDPFPHLPMRYATVAEDGTTVVQRPVKAFDMLRQVFESQAYFQGLLGHNYNNMSTEELIEYLKGQIMALQAETIEALDEMSWKPWTHGEKTINKEAMGGELADILCFLVNLALGIGLTANDFYALHQEKALRNIQRQEAKYDGVKGKCPTCRRAIDDLTAKGISTGIFGGIEFCDRVECIETYRANSTQKGI